VSLFPFPPHHDPAGDIHGYVRHPGAYFGRGKERLGPAQRTGWQTRWFFRAIVHKSFVYRAGMIVVAIEVDAVEIDIVDAESEPYNLWSWGDGQDKGEWD
jgi:hypothetical protein